MEENNDQQKEFKGLNIYIRSKCCPSPKTLKSLYIKSNRCKLASDVTVRLLGQPITAFPSEELAALRKHGPIALALIIFFTLRAAWLLFRVYKQLNGKNTLQHGNNKASVA